MIRFLMEQQGLSQADLSRCSGVHRTTLSNLLAGRRPLTLGHVEAFARGLGVPAGVFFPDAARRSARG